MGAKIIEIPPNTREWLEWRRTGIGGSDASLIGAYFLPDDCPWPYSQSWSGADLYRLWLDKTGKIEIKEQKDRSYGDYVDPLVHGHKQEQAARELYNATYGYITEPVCIQHWTAPGLLASLDGWVQGEHIVEIKCPKDPSMHRKHKEGEIPRQYMAQLYHNMCAAGEKYADFVTYFKDDLMVTRLEYDEDSVDKLREAEVIFWGWVEAGKFGGLPISGESNDPGEEWAGLIFRYFAVQEAKREMEQAERVLKREIHRLMKTSKVVGAGARASISVQPKATVQSFEKQEFLKFMIERV